MSQSFKGFENRSEQIEMLKNVIAAFNDEKISIIEAGTGTGKSFAYLIPAIAWAVKNQEKVVISTNTINLQEQLINKDLPIIKKILGIDFQATLVKGMGNYLCLRKLHDTMLEKLLLEDREQEEMEKIEAWAEHTKEGSIADLDFYPHRTTWEKVNAEGDTCSYRKCPHYQECHFFKARKQAEDAQILVVNHHLLFADLAMRAELEGAENEGVLPAYNRLIIDEAHHIESVAAEFFAKKVSRVEMMRTMAKIASEKKGDGTGRLALLKQKIVNFTRNETNPLLLNAISRMNVELPAMRREVLTTLADCFQTVAEFSNRYIPPEKENKLRLLDHHFNDPYWKGEALEHINRFNQRVESYVSTLNGLMQELRQVEDDRFKQQVEGLIMEITAYADRLGKNRDTLQRFLKKETDKNHVQWIDNQLLNTLQNVQLVDAELDISAHLKKHLFEKMRTVVLCSATLTTNKNFHFIKERLGINTLKRPVDEHLYESPFDFDRQSLVVIPKDIPMPMDETFNTKAAEKIFHALEASQGGAFVLFTSYTMMKACYKLLEKPLKNRNFNLFLQGTDHRQTLLKKFKTAKRSALFGTSSFWEGVDVSGEALQLVILVKLPFQVPSEPLIAAHTDLIKEKGKDPFFDYSLPNAIVKFKQGVGRLIRHKKDRGIILILDSRVNKKGYGQQFLNSLPPIPKILVEGDQLKNEMRSFFLRKS